LRKVWATALHVAYVITLVLISIRQGLLASKCWPVHKIEQGLYPTKVRVQERAERLLYERQPKK
jgi:hypothetical protein